jgi:hypothetical protein
MNVLLEEADIPDDREDVRSASDAGTPAARAALERAVRPVLPAHLDRQALRERMPRGETVVLSCGNADSMRDIQHIAERHGMHFEKEDW